MNSSFQSSILMTHFYCTYFILNKYIYSCQRNTTVITKSGCTAHLRSNREGFWKSDGFQCRSSPNESKSPGGGVLRSAVFSRIPGLQTEPGKKWLACGNSSKKPGWELHPEYSVTSLRWHGRLQDLPMSMGQHSSLPTSHHTGKKKNQKVKKNLPQIS